MSSSTCLDGSRRARWFARASAFALFCGAGAWDEIGAQGRDPQMPWTPAAGSPTRRGILAAVRQHVGTTATFKVAHLVVMGDYAFVRAGEVVRDGDDLQETDLFIEALLQRRNPRAAQWRAVELWNLSTESGTEHDAFLQRVHRKVRDGVIPAALLPDDLRPPGPPGM
ncbi:MAG: hypothetical protein ACT4P7_01420 [Gemmatimonadaceae bacterium]